MVTTVRVHTALEEVPAQAWNALLPDANPFLRHEFLAGLEQHGCIQRRLGWRPQHLTLWQGGTLLAAAPAYLKANSHGEFVFDHGWAEAYERLGLAYYPKLLVAVPYSPVPGPRLLARDADALALLGQSLQELCEARSLSSVHVNFVDEPGARALADAGWLSRMDWQFHWHNAGYASFDDFTAQLTSKRRKEIRRERAAFAAPPWQFRWCSGSELGEAEIDFVHRCYVATFADKGNHPALTRAFLAHLARTLPHAVQVLLATHEGEAVAMAFCLRSGDSLYGRYWGATRHVPALHFECCYYQGIARCIALGLQRFEPGAQGEHKIARGFLPAPTRSRHYVSDPELRHAIAQALAREALWMAGYRESLMAHSPYAEHGA